MTDLERDGASVVHAVGRGIGGSPQVMSSVEPFASWTAVPIS